MKIIINDKRKVYAIQQSFSGLFPNLKLEFLAKPAKSGGPASPKAIGAASTVGDCRTLHNSGVLAINPAMSSVELGKNFADAFGLTIKIMRRNDDQWQPVKSDRKTSLGELDRQSPENRQ